MSEPNEATDFLGRVVMVALALFLAGLFFFAPRTATTGFAFVFALFLLIVDQLKGSR